MSPGSGNSPNSGNSPAAVRPPPIVTAVAVGADNDTDTGSSKDVGTTHRPARKRSPSVQGGRAASIDLGESFSFTRTSSNTGGIGNAITQIRSQLSEGEEKQDHILRRMTALETSVGTICNDLEQIKLLLINGRPSPSRQHTDSFNSQKGHSRRESGQCGGEGAAGEGNGVAAQDEDYAEDRWREESVKSAPRVRKNQVRRQYANGHRRVSSQDYASQPLAAGSAVPSEEQDVTLSLGA
jgi:hypothetical protein